MAFGDVNIAGMFPNKHPQVPGLAFRVYDLGFMIRRPQAALAVSDPSLHTVQALLKNLPSPAQPPSDS